MSRNVQISTPTNRLPEFVREQNNGFHHLLPRYREGVISFEVFKRNSKGRLNTGIVHDEGGRKEHHRAREVEATAEMGIRGEGSRVGKEASLQPPEEKKRRKKSPARTQEAVTKARTRKRNNRG